MRNVEKKKCLFILQNFSSKKIRKVKNKLMANLQKWYLFDGCSRNALFQKIKLGLKLQLVGWFFKNDLDAALLKLSQWVSFS